MRRRIIAIVLSLLLIAPPHLFADWLEDWFNQYTSSGPDYYQSQRMGYITFGSFSGRLGTTGGPVHLINIEPPRVRIGCGGIDLFLGSIGFTNFEYLVQKAQQLIQAAPIVAFHLALQVLSPTLSNIVQYVENVLNFLNSLQIDECKLLRPILSLDARNIQGATLQDRLVNAWEQIKSGYKRMWEDYKKQFQEKPVLSSEVREAVSNNCPPVVLSVYDSGSLLAYLLRNYSRESGGSSTFEDLARAITGDFVITNFNATNGVAINYNVIDQKIRPDDLKKNRLVRVSKYGTESIAELDLVSRVATILNEAYEAKRNKSSPPSDYITLARLSPIPVESILNVAVLTRNPAILVGIAPAVAQGVMYNLLVDIASEASYVISQLPQTSVDPQKCPGINHISSAAAEMRKRAWEAADVISQLYKDTLNEVNVTLSVASRILDYENIVKSALAKYYNFGLISNLISRSLSR